MIRIRMIGVVEIVRLMSQRVYAKKKVGFDKIIRPLINRIIHKTYLNQIVE